MDIIISKEEIKEYEKLKVISQLTLVKEKIKLFESKYGCSLDRFREEIEKNEENFGKWDDYIEWKANYETILDLEKKISEINNAKNIKIV